MRNLLLIFCLTAILGCQSSSVQETATTRTDFVDPFIGTAAHGHTYPGATVPFGMVQLSPDNGTPGWDWCAGYNYEDDVIIGFSHTHLSGTGIGDLYDILFTPTTEKLELHAFNPDPRKRPYASHFSHEGEKAEPGYYQVRLSDTDIQVELTTTKRVGIHRYTFPKDAQASVLIDLGYRLNWDLPTDSRLEALNDNTVVGHRFSTGWAKDQRIYFAAQFSQPIINSTIFADTTMLPSKDNAAPQTDMKSIGQLMFKSDAQSQLVVKVGISSASQEGAIAALEEAPGWDFDAFRQAAHKAWENSLSVIDIDSKNDSLKRIFYTALYHTQLAPVLFSDAQNQYKGVDGQVHTADGYTKYGIFSLWDTFRAAHPLFTITQPDKVNDMIRSLLSHYREYGLLPVWSLLGNETNTMTGYHAIPVITDAYLKGYRDFDAEEAFAAMKKSAMQDIRATNFLREYNYIPYDKAGQSVTRTLEYAYDDWCIAQMAKALGKNEEYDYFMKRAANYRNLFDPSTGFMRAKLADGSWKSPFDPKYSSHDFSTAEYTEGNAWQHAWFVPHDVQGMIDLHGGNEAFIAKLDQLFTEDSDIKGDNASMDISGLIGQYAHGNEPSHHIAYLYSYAGAAWKTQATVRDIMKSQYTAQPDGLCGNEDCGQMSAWYVFSAMGLYPVNPAEGIYVIGSPLFESASFQLSGGKSFTIDAKAVSDTNMYIQSAELNGKALERTWLTHAEIMQGGKLQLIMGPKPNLDWGKGKTAVPPSVSRKTEG
ncbi:MAG: GH92 family glycosyl hydrolase [Bacteroidota bacterium]